MESTLTISKNSDNISSCNIVFIQRIQGYKEASKQSADACEVDVLNKWHDYAMFFKRWSNYNSNVGETEPKRSN